MGEWITYRLSELADVRDGTHDFPKQAVEGYPLVTSRHIKGRSIDFDNTYKISPADFDSVNKRSKVEKWDLLFSMIGTIGAKVLIDFEPYFAIKNVGLFKFGSELAAKWVYYYFDGNEAKEELDARLKGSTQQFIALGDLRTFPIRKPSDKHAQLIIEILSSLDDKIDLLHRQNKTLEALAESYFRHCFVDGAQENWDCFSVRDIADHIKITVNPSASPHRMFQHYSLPAFDSGMKPASEIGGQILSNKYKIVPYSILVSKLNPRFPRIWPLGELLSDDAICSTEFQVLKPKNPEDFGFLLSLLRSEHARQTLEASASGTSGSHQRVTPADILNIEFLAPREDVLQEFSAAVQPLVEKTWANQGQIVELENLRDTLLPKLMSGHVRVEYEAAA